MRRIVRMSENKVDGRQIWKMMLNNNKNKGKLELEKERRRETLQNNEHGREKAVNVVCLCVFVPVCVSRDSQWGQRVSVAPCVAYKLIKDNRDGGKAPPHLLFVSMWGCIQGQAQKENQLENQEACGLKLVLENGLQIEIGNSGTADLHACVATLEQKHGASQKRVLLFQRGTFFFSHSLSQTQFDWATFFF